ncbi:MAG: phosphatase PAP2 family protein [Flavobacteriaceae bacterium]|nr:phosphatase PAP2 family protein [Flavobacteriaceae bacterium]
MVDDNSKLNGRISVNFINVKLWFLFPAVFLLLLISYYFLFVSAGNNFIDAYISSQKDLFFYLNDKLSEYPVLVFNLTQLGDVLISFSLLSVFIVYAPKLWEVLFTSAILSLIVSASLKKLFSVPRPAAVFDPDNFSIIGRTLSGNTALPSGHSIATFVVVTVLLFAFMPKKKIHRILWVLSLLIIGLVIALSRVGVGAHYPLDVVIGSTLGFMVSVIGIRINNKMKWFRWIKNKKYYPVFILLFAICIWVIITKTGSNNLLIFYFSISSLIVTLYLIISFYVKKN